MRGGKPLAHLNLTPVHTFERDQGRHWPAAGPMTPISPADHAQQGLNSRGPAASTPCGALRCFMAITDHWCQSELHQPFSWMPTQGIAIELSDQQALALSKTAPLLHVSELELSAADLVLSKDQEPCRR